MEKNFVVDVFHFTYKLTELTELTDLADLH